MLGSKEKRNKRRLSVLAMILIDVGLYVISMGGFLLYFYVFPHHLDQTGKVVAQTNTSESQFEIADSKSSYTATIDEEKNTSGYDRKPSMGGQGHNIGNTSNENTSAQKADEAESESIQSSDKTSQQIQSFTSDKVTLNIEKVSTGSGADKVTYYVADVKASNIAYIRSAFAKGEYGKNIRESVKAMANDSKALLALSGDYYGNSETGVVIRNGILYRSDVTETDICVLFLDGTMKTYSPEEFNGNDVIAEGAWQAWTFGPALLDSKGNIPSSYNSTSYLNSENPRAAIGYVEPGHYVFVVVDGRDEGYSRGVTLSELSGIMSELGCTAAYNLDGGKSAAMVYDGDYVNQPADGGRTISDIIYISEDISE